MQTKYLIRFQLVQPEVGGATAFTNAGIAAKPIQGSAVFWYNIFKDGTTDYSTYHGGCPVVLGTKWGKEPNSSECVKKIRLTFVFFSTCLIYSWKQMDKIF